MLDATLVLTIMLRCTSARVWICPLCSAISLLLVLLQFCSLQSKRSTYICACSELASIADFAVVLPDSRPIF